MPTLAQLVRRKQERRVKNGEKRTPALQNSPQKRGVCLRVYTKAPKKPNSACLLYTSPSPRDKRQARMPSSA